MALLSFSRLPTKNELKGICVDILSHMALLRFFCLTSHLLINFSSDFVFFCVFMCFFYIFLFLSLVFVSFCSFFLFVFLKRKKKKGRGGMLVDMWISYGSCWGREIMKRINCMIKFNKKKKKKQASKQQIF